MDRGVSWARGPLGLSCTISNESPRRIPIRHFEAVTNSKFDLNIIGFGKQLSAWLRSCDGEFFKINTTTALTALGNPWTTLHHLFKTKHWRCWGRSAQLIIPPYSLINSIIIIVLYSFRWTSCTKYIKF